MLLLRLDSEAISLSPKPEVGRPARRALVRGLPAIEARHRQRLGQVGVVAQVLPRVGDGELQARRGRPAAPSATIIWKMPELTPPAEITLVELLEIEADLGRRPRALRRSRPRSSSPEVVDQLEHVAGPGGPTWKMFSQKPRAPASALRSRLGSAPTMVFRRPSSASLRRARERRVDERDALRREVRADARASTPARRSSVDDDQARARPRRAGRPRRRRSSSTCGEPVTQMNTMSAASASGLRSTSPPSRRRRAGPARFDAVAVHHEGQRKALGEQVLRHAVAHHADADEADPLLSCRLRCRMSRGAARADARPLPERDEARVARGDLVDRPRSSTRRPANQPRAASAKIERPTAKPLQIRELRGDREARSQVASLASRPSSSTPRQWRSWRAITAVDLPPRRARRWPAAASTSRAGCRRRRSARARARSRRRAAQLARRDHLDQQLVDRSPTQAACSATQPCDLRLRAARARRRDGRAPGTWRRARRGQARSASATLSPASNASGREPGSSTGRAIQQPAPVSAGSTSSP